MNQYYFRIGIANILKRGLYLYRRCKLQKTQGKSKLIKFNKAYSPARLIKVFRVILTIFMLIRQKERVFIFRPLKPRALKNDIYKLGASFIKLAQVLATRSDFFPPAYIEELRQLHDEIPKMKKSEFEKVKEIAFGDCKDCFSSFDQEPIASASIGQVHKAKLADGTEVAVKLRRLGIERIIRADIRILKYVSRLLRPLFSVYTKNSIEAVIDEFSKMIVREVDLGIELSNLKKFANVYSHSTIRFPDVYEKYCSRDALVMSFEHGYRFDDKEQLKKLNISFKDIMGKLIVFYTEQMLVKGYFHADPHPGNLFVTDDGELILLDFGMVKNVAPATRRAIIQLVKGANERDFETYINACKRLGVIALDAPDEDMQELAERMFDIFANDSLDATSMQTLAFDVLDNFRDMPFKLPQEAIYIMRASSIIEGLGTTYIDNFNGVKDILPILKESIPRALGAEEGLISMAFDEAKELPITIQKIKKIIDDTSEDNLAVKLSKEQTDLYKEQFRKAIKPIITGVLLIVTGFYFQTFDFEYKQLVSIICYGAGIIRILSAV